MVEKPKRRQRSFSLTNRQIEYLETLAARLQISVDELMRRLLDHMIESTAK
jgi:hypothetical protein